LDKLAKGVTVPVQMVETRQTGGTIGAPPGYQTGGLINLPAFAQGGITNLLNGGFMPGFGGGDRRLVLVEDGEIVIRKERTAQFYPLLHAINYASSNRLQQVLHNLPQFNQGGLINRLEIPALSTAASKAVSGSASLGLHSGETVVINLSLNHKPVASFFGERDQALKLARSLQELERGVF